MDNLSRAPERDPELASALRDAYGTAPEADFDALRGAVMARAELPLARMRREQPRTFGGRFRSLVPLAAAAGIAGTALALTLHPGRTDRPHQVSEADRQQVEQILNESLPSPGELIAGQSGGEELLNAAIGS
jgi:hypothetical protein